MNRQATLSALFAAVALMFIGLSTAQGNSQGELKKGDRTDTISVPEMQCGMCEDRIEKAVKGLKGISSVKADAEANRVIVSYNPNTVSQEKIETAIAEAGYDAGSATTTAAAQSKLHACCRPGAHE